MTTMLVITFTGLILAAMALDMSVQPRSAI